MDGPSVPPKPASLNEKGSYSSMAQRLMSKMGYVEGGGLGRAGQGRVEPVGISTQRGRRGLGHIVRGLEDDDNVDYDATKEHVVIEETVSWIPRVRMSL